MIFSDQLRAARALAGLTQQQIADLAKLSVPTVKRAEGGNEAVASRKAIAAIAAAYARIGIELLDDSEGHGAGVRWRSSRSAGGDALRREPGE